MEFFYVVLAIPVVVALIWGVVGGVQTNNMMDNFTNLGNLTGKSLDDIVGAVGSPDHISTLPDGTVLYQWISNKYSTTGSYHVALIFENNLCLGVSSESLNT